MLDSFIVVDLETTSREPSGASILTGCFLHCDSDLNIIDRLDIKSKYRLWNVEAEQASAIHGISEQEARKFPLWSEVGQRLSDWLDIKPISHFVCHSNRTIFGKFHTYDYAVLKYNLFDLNLHWNLYRTCPEWMILSTHSLAKHLAIELGLGRELNLKSLSTSLGLKEFDHHDASADALKALEILKILLPRTDVRKFLDKEYFKLQENENETERSSPKNQRRSRKFSLNS
jgi:DNA polymerase III epsilon subunit-like protein